MINMFLLGLSNGIASTLEAIGFILMLVGMTVPTFILIILLIALAYYIDKKINKK